MVQFFRLKLHFHKPNSHCTHYRRSLFSNKSNVYKYHQKKTRYKILQQDQGLLDRTLKISIRWRKIVANQLEIHLLSSPVLCTLHSTASIAVILSILSLAATCGTRSVLLRVARPISQPRLELTGLPVFLGLIKAY